MYNSVQQALLKLQKIDLDVLGLKKAYTQHQAHAKVAEIERALKALGVSQEKLEGQKHELEKVITAGHDEIEAAKAKIQTDQLELARTSDPRTTQALSKDVDAHTRRIDKIEFDEVKLLEEVDELASKIAAVSEKVAKLTEARTKTIEGLAQLKIKVDQKIESLLTKRAQALDIIGDDIARTYESLHGAGNGVAVGEFINHTCTVCRVKLATTQIDEILEKSGSYAICPSCKRMIVVE